MKSENTKCLQGIRCPKCGSLEPFITIARFTVLVTDDGIEERASDADFDNYEDGAKWQCGKCQHEDTVEGFFTDASPGV